ncbi:MAG: hypothetical protein CL471_07595 [Acidobacteria bacterium]|nr:hypothetical protein [Acidobacteriota bacterium]
MLEVRSLRTAERSPAGCEVQHDELVAAKTAKRYGLAARRDQLDVRRGLADPWMIRRRRLVWLLGCRGGTR